MFHNVEATRAKTLSAEGLLVLEHPFPALTLASHRFQEVSTRHIGRRGDGIGPAFAVARSNADSLKRFMLEEWIARRLNSPHVLKAYPDSR